MDPSSLSWVLQRWPSSDREALVVQQKKDDTQQGEIARKKVAGTQSIDFIHGIFGVPAHRSCRSEKLCRDQNAVATSLVDLSSSVRWPALNPRTHTHPHPPNFFSRGLKYFQMWRCNSKQCLLLFLGVYVAFRVFFLDDLISKKLA